MARIRAGEHLKMLTVLPVNIDDYAEAHDSFTWQAFNALKSGKGDEIMATIVKFKSLSAGQMKTADGTWFYRC